jgi:hypothetical protein
VTPAVAQSIASKAATSFTAWLPSQTAAIAASPTAQQPSGIGAQASSDPPTRVARPASGAAPRPGPTTGSIGRETAVVVPAVTGAPGDGSNTLAAAIQRELTSKGVALADRPTTVAYRVEGTVTMGEPQAGKQAIHIEWLVRDPAGKRLGTVSQRNEIPEGSLDGAWGKTAEQAAGAAAQGILKLLPAAKAVN